MRHSFNAISAVSLMRSALLGTALLAAAGFSSVGSAQSFTTSTNFGDATSGTCSGSGANLTVTGSGSGVSDRSLTDNFHFCSTTESGNFMLTARVVSVGVSATVAGIQLRDTTMTSSSRNEMIYVKPASGNMAPSTNRRQFNDNPNLSTDRPIKIYAEPDTGYPGETQKMWIRLIRYNDEISLLYSPDVSNSPYQWRASTSNQSLTGLTSTNLDVGFAIAGTSSTATFDNISLTAITVPPTQPETNWLGNTFPGGGNFMLYRGQALAIDPTNRIYVQGQGEAQSLSSFSATTGAFYTYYSHSHYNTRPGVAYSCGFVWSAEGGDPAASLAGIAYYTPDGAVSTTTSLYNFDTGTAYSSLAADPSACTLYALEEGTGTIHVINTTGVSTTHAPVQTSTFNLSSGAAVAIAFDKTTPGIWAILAGTTKHGQKFTLTGAATGSLITGLKDPRALAVDASGNVYITDHDPTDQRIHVFTSTGSYLRTLGLQKGSYAESVPGTIAATSLDHPEGIALDSSNNLYVTSSGPDTTVAADNFGNSGATMRRYNTNTGTGASAAVTTLSASNLAWQNAALDYIDGASPDSSDDLNVYDKFHHFVLNYSNFGKPNSGSTSIWKYQGELLDDATYPDDPRISDYRDAGAYVRHINGYKLLIVPDQNSQKINMYRFLSNSNTPSDERTAPYARFLRETNRGQTPDNFEIWVDTNLNGSIDSTNPNCTAAGSNGEEACTTTFVADPSGEFFAWYMDIDGNIWTVGGTSGAYKLYEFYLQGSGAPTWSFAAGKFKTWPLPAAFTGGTGTIYPLRLLYDAPNDALFVTGYTAAKPKDTAGIGFGGVGGGFIGTQILRYDNWSTQPQTPATAQCTITLADIPTPPPASGVLGNGARAFDLAHGLLVTENDFTNHIDYYYAYDSRCPQGTVTPSYSYIPGPEVGSVSGTIDSAHVVNLFWRTPDQYLTFTEEGGQHKILVFNYQDSSVPQP